MTNGRSVIKQVRYDLDGGPLCVEVRCGHAQPGSYAILLWEADTNEVVLERRGNFINPDDDRYELTGSLEDHNGRIIECIANVVLLPPEKRYRIGLAVDQNHETIGAEVAAAESDLPSITVTMYLELVRRGNGNA